MRRATLGGAAVLVSAAGIWRQKSPRIPPQSLRHAGGCHSRRDLMRPRWRYVVAGVMSMPRSALASAEHGECCVGVCSALGLRPRASVSWRLREAKKPAPPPRRQQRRRDATGRALQPVAPCTGRLQPTRSRRHRAHSRSPSGGHQSCARLRRGERHQAPRRARRASTRDAHLRADVGLSQRPTDTPRPRPDRSPRSARPTTGASRPMIKAFAVRHKLPAAAERRMPARRRRGRPVTRGTEVCALCPRRPHRSRNAAQPYLDRKPQLLDAKA